MKNTGKFPSQLSRKSDGNQDNSLQSAPKLPARSSEHILYSLNRPLENYISFVFEN